MNTAFGDNCWPKHDKSCLWHKAVNRLSINSAPDGHRWPLPKDIWRVWVDFCTQIVVWQCSSYGTAIDSFKKIGLQDCDEHVTDEKIFCRFGVKKRPITASNWNTPRKCCRTSLFRQIGYRSISLECLSTKQKVPNDTTRYLFAAKRPKRANRSSSLRLSKPAGPFILEFVSRGTTDNANSTRKYPRDSNEGFVASGRRSVTSSRHPISSSRLSRYQLPDEFIGCQRWSSCPTVPTQFFQIALRFYAWKLRRNNVISEKSTQSKRRPPRLL